MRAAHLDIMLMGSTSVVKSVILMKIGRRGQKNVLEIRQGLCQLVSTLGRSSNLGGASGRGEGTRLRLGRASRGS